MKTIFPMAFIAGILLLTTLSSSAAENSADLEAGPGILPSSPFYVFDLAAESVKGWFFVSDVSKSKYALELAEERLAEASEELRVDPDANVDVLMQDYDRHISRAANLAGESGNLKLDALLEDRISVHVSVLENLEGSFGANQAPSGIVVALANAEHAFDRSSNRSG